MLMRFQNFEKEGNYLTAICHEKKSFSSAVKKMVSCLGTLKLWAFVIQLLQKSWKWSLNNIRP